MQELLIYIHKRNALFYMNKLLIYVQNSDVTFSVQELLINSLRPEKGRDILRSTASH